MGRKTAIVAASSELQVHSEAKDAGDLQHRGTTARADTAALLGALSAERDPELRSAAHEEHLVEAVDEREIEIEDHRAERFADGRAARRYEARRLDTAPSDARAWPEPETIA